MGERRPRGPGERVKRRGVARDRQVYLAVKRIMRQQGPNFLGVIIEASGPIRAATMADLDPDREIYLRMFSGPCVYVVEAVELNAVKIGFVQDGITIFNRVRALSTGCPAELIPRAVVRGTLADEQEAHRFFAPERLVGEWFRLSPRVQRFIDSLRKHDSIGTAYWDADIGDD